MRFAIVLPTLNEGPLLEMTVDSVITNSGNLDFRIVVVDDGCTDGCIDPVAARKDERIVIVPGGGLGVARARNRGAEEVEADILVFMDAHCRVSEAWLERFAEVLQDPGVGMVGPSFTKLKESDPRGCGMRWDGWDLDPCWFSAPENEEPIEVPLTTGACQVLRRDTFDMLSGYDPKFTKWGYEDVEMCLRVWSMGRSVVAHPGVTVAHDFKESRDNYDIPEEGVLFNFLRMVYLHFSSTRIRQLLAHFADYPPIQQAQARLFDSGIFEDRVDFANQRVRDDSWYFANVNGELV